MGATDVQIRIAAKDDASAAFQQLARNAENTQQSIESFGNSLTSMHSVLSMTAAYTAAIAGLNGVGDALHSVMGEALEYYKTMETGSVSLAGSLMSMAKIGDQQIGWNDALKISKQLMSDLSDQALVTGSSTKEISEVFRAMLPNALNAKMTLEQTMQLAGALTTTGKAMGLDGSTLARDVKDLISGNNVQRTALGIQLGLTNADIANAKQSADGLFNFLKERLRGEIEANGHYLDTFEGRLNHLKESVSRIGGMAAMPLLKEATGEMGKLADKFVQVDVASGTVTGINKEFVEGIRDAAIVAEHLGAGVLEVGSDLSHVVAPALQVVVPLIELAAQHSSTLMEVLMGFWAGRKITDYVQDYRNAVTGAAEAHTFLGKAAEQARLRIEAEAAAQRQIQMTTANQSMSAITTNSAATGRAAMNTEAIAKQISLETALGSQLARNAELEANRIAVANTAKTAFTGALAAVRAGETELAVRILETSATLEAQGTAAEMMAARATQAITLVKAGQTELAEQILTTTLSNELQGVAGLQAGKEAAAGAVTAKAAQIGLATQAGVTTTAIAATGASATTAGVKAVTAGAAAGSAIKNLISLAFNLAGGWIGVAVAIGTALYKLWEFVDAQAEYEKNHTFYYNGENWIVSKDGKIHRENTNTPIVPDYTGVGADGPTNDSVSDEDRAAIMDMVAQRDEELKEEERRKEIEAQKENMKEGLKLYQEMFNDPETRALMGQVQGMYTGEGAANSKEAAKAQKEAAKAQREATKAAREQAQANKTYADTIAENAKKIAQANKNVQNIIEQLNNKILEETGTQLQIDMAKISSDWKKTEEDIQKGIVTLKTYNPKITGADSGNTGYSTEQNWKEELLSGDDAVTTATAQKMHLLAQKYLELTGQEMTVTSMHRYGDGSSHHDDGEAFDISDDVLAQDAELRHQLAAYGTSIGLTPLDEYETQYGPNGEYYGSDNIHFTENHTPLPELTAGTTTIQPTVSQDSAAIPQTDMVQIIEKAAAALGFSDIPLALSVAAIESGGGDIKNIGAQKYNASSGATGIFQVLDGQDILGSDGQRHNIADMFPNYKTDDYENALAGIMMLMDKINNGANGNVWEGVSLYGGGGEYADLVRGVYDSMGGGSENLAPTARYTLYKSPLMDEARRKNDEYRKLATDKANREYQQRVRKGNEEIGQIYDEYSTENGTDNRLKALQDKAAADVAAINDKMRDYIKEFGKNETDTVQAAKYAAAQIFKIKSEEAEKERELHKTQHKEYLNHLDAQGMLQEDAASNINVRRQAELELFVEYQKKMLDEAKLTAQQRLTLEKELAENMKKLHELGSQTDWSAGLMQLGRSMKEYQQDIGSALTSGFNSLTGTIEGTFDNMLTSNESFATRMKNLYVSIANTILNTMMKVIMQGLIMNSILQAFGLAGGAKFSTVDFGYSDTAVGSYLNNETFAGGASSWTYSTPKAFASGGYITPGYYMAGEEGRELIQMSGNGYVHNARETSNILASAAKSQGNGAGIDSVEVRIINEGGQQVKTTKTDTQIDGKKLIVSTVLEAVATDYMGARTMLKGAVK
nr:MAG TPA: minor tail protein [Caudoviricetes sp.]